MPYRALTGPDATNALTVQYQRADGSWGTVAVTRAQVAAWLAAHPAATAAQLEAQANVFLAAAWADRPGDCVPVLHVYGLSPLHLAVAMRAPGVTLDPSWWQPNTEPA